MEAAAGEADSALLDNVLVKGALISAWVMGCLAAYYLLTFFRNELEPLVLAGLFVGCLDSIVTPFEALIVHLPGLVCWAIPSCLCRCYCCCRLWDIWRKPAIGDAPLLPSESPPGAADSRTVAEEGLTTLIPENVKNRIQDWYNMESVGVKAKAFLPRLLATLITLILVCFGLSTLATEMIRAMKHVDYQPYKEGLFELVNVTLDLADELNLTSNDSVVQAQIRSDMTQWSSDLTQAASSFLGELMSSSTTFFTQLTFFFLYSLMWLLQPMESQATIFKIVRTYFVLKTGCNLIYACLCYALMNHLRIDPAILIAISCFVLAYIPEVGAVIAVALPAPLVLLDARVMMLHRLWLLLWATVGMLGIKLAVANGLESVLMGKSPILSGRVDDDSGDFAETHPVVVLFVVVLCGAIWGPTGMMISVPLISVVRYYFGQEQRRADSRRTAASP